MKPIAAGCIPAAAPAPRKSQTPRGRESQRLSRKRPIEEADRLDIGRRHLPDDLPGGPNVLHLGHPSSSAPEIPPALRGGIGPLLEGPNAVGKPVGRIAGDPVAKDDVVGIRPGRSPPCRSRPPAPPGWRSAASPRRRRRPPRRAPPPSGRRYLRRRRPRRAARFLPLNKE